MDVFVGDGRGYQQVPDRIEREEIRREGDMLEVPFHGPNMSWGGMDRGECIRRERLEENGRDIILGLNIANGNRPCVSHGQFGDKLEEKSKVPSLTLDMLHLNCPWDFPLAVSSAGC